MQEQLLTAIVRRDEAKAFRYVVPLDGSRALPRTWGSLLRRRALGTLLLLFISQEVVERISQLVRLVRRNFEENFLTSLIFDLKPIDAVLPIHRKVSELLRFQSTRHLILQSVLRSKAQTALREGVGQAYRAFAYARPYGDRSSPTSPPARRFVENAGTRG